jgi:hypothetical protein
MERFQLKKKGKGKQEYTYGEIVYTTFLPLLEFAITNAIGDQIFWDIGCGSAKPVAMAAMLGKFKRAKGIEYLPDLAKLA